MATIKSERLLFFITGLLTVSFSSCMHSMMSDIHSNSNHAKPTTKTFSNDSVNVTPSQPSHNNLDGHIDDLCLHISTAISENNKTTIAVMGFSDFEGNVTHLGKYLSEEVTTRLFQTKKFKVMERQLLNKIIKEQKLQVSGIIDDTSAIKLGKLLGVNTIVTGTVTEFANSVKINARLIGTETGEIFGTASIEIPKDESVQKLLRIKSNE
ncbi:MAG: CsgG/HfaB family protein [Bacteroidota bacterium]